jgi:Putative peptidoglycan binding domain
MKSILYSVCIGSLALALTAGAAQDNKRKPERAKPQHRTANVHATRPANTGRTMSVHRNVSAAQYRQRSYAKARTSSAFNRAARPASATPATVRERNLARNERMREGAIPFRPTMDRSAYDAAKNFQRKQEFRARRDVAVNRTREADVNRFRNANEFRGRNNVAINRNRNFAVNRTGNAAYYSGGKVRITNNWRGDEFRGQRYATFRNYHRQWHDRGWWRSHYDRIIFVNNGWYYWNAGYWFPAWGYAPSVTYVYDGPIYAYNGLSPDQVTVNVQEQLARAGYYDGPIDGLLGPMTREAIAAYQADNGLAITSAIDEPTLATLGLV